VILEEKSHLSTPRRTTKGLLSDIQRFASDKSRFPQSLFGCVPPSCTASTAINAVDIEGRVP
jgi:hypothetical protein